MSGKCPVCADVLTKSETRSDGAYFECSRCGSYSLGDRARAILDSELSRDKKARAILSHAIYKMSRGSQRPKISDVLMRGILNTTDLTLPSAQLNNLITWLGTTQSDPGARVDAVPQAIAAVGAVDYNGLGFVVSEAKRRGLVSGEVKYSQAIGSATPACMILPMQLTMEGWDRFGELLRGRSIGRVAFMAMPFGDVELDQLYRQQFQPAVAATGFTLKRLDEGQPAGLIDDRLRIEIRQSRFLISDLTHRNPGAYWEAGYAEGLNKPVIYTCRKDVFDDKLTGPHFDTNHHLTVVWSPEDLEQAMAKLKSTIRATLPDETVLTD